MTDIAWQAWSEDVFAEATRRNTPILLSLVAPWDQFSRTMDEQTYSNEALAQFVNDNFLAVRVDTDKHPDINTRYGQGGWPSTCILTPDGDLLWGGLFLPQQDMAQMLTQVKYQFDNNKPGVQQHIAQQRDQIRQSNAAPPLDPSVQISSDVAPSVLLGIKHNFDFAFGGFGHAGSKFPHTDAVEFVMEQYAYTDRRGTADVDLRLMIDRTLSGMADGGLYDQGSGGFFRYTQTPDWREPQVEKLLEDNAVLARVYAHAYSLTGDEKYKAVAKATLDYLQAQLYDSETGTWGGSQFADAEYYSQPLAERSEWNPPTVDPTIYCGPNAQAVRAHAAYYAATGETESLTIAKRGLDFLLSNLLQADGAPDHYLPAEEEEDPIAPAGRIPSGLLSDCNDLISACLDLYEAGQGAGYLDRGEEVANWVRGHLEDPRAGGLNDAVARPDAVGNLKVPTREVQDNLQVADALLRLYLATGEENHAHAGQRILQAFYPALPQLGFFGATYALAAERAVLPPVIVHVIGSLSDSRTSELLAAAHRVYRYEKFIQPLDPSDEADAEHIENLGYELPGVPVAFVTVGPNTLDPITDPARLSDTVRSAF